MKSPRLNSTNPNILTSIFRDQMYLKHLREVQRINNRQANDLKVSLKEYRSISELRHKHQQSNKEFMIHENQRKLNDQNFKIHLKIKNIRSMFSFNGSVKKHSELAESAENHRYNGSNQESNPQGQTDNNNNKINVQVSQSKNLSSNAGNQNQNKTENESVNNQLSVSVSKQNRKKNNNNRSFHYYFRKKQQQQIQIENKKLIGAILNQKSPYRRSPDASIRHSSVLAHNHQQVTEQQKNKQIQNKQANMKQKQLKQIELEKRFKLPVVNSGRRSVTVDKIHSVGYDKRKSTKQEITKRFKKIQKNNRYSKTQIVDKQEAVKQSKQPKE